MFDLRLQVDLGSLPLLPEYKALLSGGFKIPAIDRRVSFYLDLTRYLSLGGTTSINFVSTHNFDLGLALGPIGISVIVAKPFNVEDFLNSLDNAVAADQIGAPDQADKVQTPAE